MVAFDGVIQ